jgi:hypothetical protein
VGSKEGEKELVIRAGEKQLDWVIRKTRSNGKVKRRV